MIAAKPDDLSSVPRTYTEGKNYFKKLSSNPHAHKLTYTKIRGENVKGSLSFKTFRTPSHWPKHQK